MDERPRALEEMVIDPKFWAGKRVFLTGHTGFKGAWLSLWLQQMGARVTGYARRPESSPNLFTLANVQRGMRSIVGDVRDARRLERALRAARPQIVIHMAAQAYVIRGYQDPVFTYSTNVLGTLNLLEVCRRSPTVKVVVNVTTDKCYENRHWSRGYKETDALGGR